MDELDSEILRLLQTDARLSNRELARRLGIAPSTCLERVRSLTRRGVIKGYHADIDLAALGRGTQAYVAVQMQVHNRTAYDSLKAALRQWPEVLSLCAVTGDHDLLLHVAVADPDHLHAFLVDRLAKRREVARFRSMLIFQWERNPVLSPLETTG